MRRLAPLAAVAAALLLPAAAQAQSPPCPCTVFAPTDAPSGNAQQDQPLEVGMKVRPTEDGFITALRFYKQPNNSGRHVGHLWSASGERLAEVEFTGESAEGWQEELLATPVPVAKDTTYVVSYHSANGYFGFSPGYFTAPVGSGPLRAPAEGNGVYRYGPSGFPEETWNATNYWVDATFERSGGEPADTRPPRVSAVTPADGATGVAPTVKPTATFDEAVDSATVTTSSFSLRTAAGAAVPAAVAYDAGSRTATLTPSAPLADGETYTATVKGGAGGVADTAGNRLAADRTWSFSGPPRCPCTVFAPTDGPLGDAQQDDPLEVGMKIRSSEDGFITALRFYKQPSNTGRHVGHLWSASGERLAEVEFTDETPSGWQEARLPTPVPIERDTTYVASYHSSTGRYGFSPGGLSGGAGSGPLRAPAGENGVFRYGPSGFPDSSFNATNYWVDATFERTTPADTRAPRVAAVTPAAGAEGVARSTTVTATFDEPVDPATVNAGSFRLVDAAGDPVVAAVSYDAPARRATLTPQAPLDLGKTYTATVKTGTGGVADLAGNALAADVTWSFATGAQCPCTLFSAAEAPEGAAAHDQPLEVGVKLRPAEDGFITALRFYKQANNTGRHVGHLWSGTGQLLATAPFEGETASGWQQVELPNPVAVTRDTTYVASYHSANGFFAFSPGFFTSARDRSPLVAPASGASGGNGVFRYGASGFPDSSWNATNYWVDATFERTVPPDTRGPSVTELQPRAGAGDVPRDAAVTAAFDEPLDPATVTASSFTLREAGGALVPATVSYDAQSRMATLRPQAPLAAATEYTATLEGGAGGIADAAGNPLAADRTWTFTAVAQSPAEGPGGPIVVLAAPNDPFTRFHAEILRAEGLNAFDVVDQPVTAAVLAGHSTAILSARPVTAAEVSALTTWVQDGGNLIAMRPDKQLAGLLGLSDAGGTLSDAYLKVDTGTAAGAGIDGQTLQFHHTADRYTLSGAAQIARLYSSSTTATSNPAVTLRSVGTRGGQVAAFTYDLARSVVYTRQGNPAWAGQKRDGTPNGIRSNDLFYGPKVGDVQPNWVDMAKIDVPQADEQQRLLANLVTEMSLDALPLPRFWYLPRGEKAAVVLTGDDHAVNGTPAYFDRLRSSSPDGCSVADWECVRASSYLYPDTAMTDAQVAAYQAEGFEVGLHLNTFCNDYTPATIEQFLTTQLAAFEAAWPTAEPPVSNRTHCIVWSDWASQARAERAHGIRFDTNYYYNGPPGWLTKPGLLTGSGFPMRFADLDGSLIDVYQAMTQVTDESDMPTTPQLHALLDNALGPKAYYGVFTTIYHSDYGDHARMNEVVAEAQERGVPVVSSAQMLDWLDGRNASSFGDLAYADGRLEFSVATTDKARGLEAMLPARAASGPLSALTRDGQPVSWEERRVKGVDYAVFEAAAGSYVARYAADTSPPVLSSVAATADAEGRATITWRTDEPATSRVQYGRDAAALGYEAADTARVSRHERELTGLQPGTTYAYRVSSADAGGRTATSGVQSFQTPPGGLVDTRTAEFGAGTQAGTHAGGTLDGLDGEVSLAPVVAEEFEGTAVPAAWRSSPWSGGGLAGLSRGALFADGAVAHTTATYEAPRTLEFSATFQPVNDQGVGFSNDLSDFPFAAFTTGNSGQPFQVYAQSGAGPSSAQETPLPGVRLNVPHRFRIEWRPASVTYFVDGVPVATHAVAIPQPMRPVVSDYGAFGAGVRVDWLRQSSYAASGTFTSRVLDSGPGAAAWLTLTAQRTLPAGTTLAFDTRSGAAPAPDGTWSAWQAVGAGGAIASPPGRFLQYRARMASASGEATPALERVQVDYGAGANAAPSPGAVAVDPGAPRTVQSVTATATGFSDPDGDALDYRYQWLRNGTPIPGATEPALDLAQPGVGDRGDAVRVRVTATDGRGAASDPVSETVTVDDTAPTAGAVALQPAPPSTNDVLTAVPSGFADEDGDELGYRYAWERNGTPIAGATDRRLDLAEAGHGDEGDVITVRVVADDGHGGTSPAAERAATVTGANATPVEGTVTLSPTDPRTDQVLRAEPGDFRDPDRDPLDYEYRWLRGDVPIAGATGPALDLAPAGHGDRGDVVRVEVRASDPSEATSDPAGASATVANTAPTAGSVAVRPAAPASDDVVSAVARDFADADGDAVAYRYRWRRNGAPLEGATGRTLDLGEPGNGDPGDRIEVEVSALDGNGGESDAVTGAETVVDGASHAVAAYGFEEAAGATVADAAGGNDGTLEGASRADAGRFGRALSFDGTDDVATVPGSPTLALETEMTLEAWVRPAAATDWRTVVFKESVGGLAYALYANGDEDAPSVHVSVGGDQSARGVSDLPPNAWSHLAATYDGATLRLFVDGAQVAARALEGELSPGDGPLTFGANAVWGEHFSGLIDEVRVYDRALSAAEIGADMGRPVVEGTPEPPPSDAPEQIGRFASLDAWPIVPVHLALTSDGQVAAWDGFEAAVDSEHTWSPWTGQFDAIASGRNLFCAGHVTLQDGRLLVVGGHIQAYEGTKETNLLDPAAGTWTRGRDMAVARWYPTATALPDGRVFVVSGDGITLDEPGHSVPMTNASDTLPEVYDPEADEWTELPGAARRMPLYPFMFVLPDGRLFDAGPDTTTRTLDLDTGRWTTVGESPIDGQSAVMYRPGKVLKSGTWADPEFPGLDVTARAAAIDMTAPAPAWREVAPMNYERAYHTLTVLPDGDVLATGGQAASDGVDERTGILATELWDPDTGEWTVTASHRRPRLYHSSALLLPDGRVLLAGGGAFGTAKNEENAEIYSPPYLFKGPRPSITSAPGRVGYGESFSVETPDAARIQSASLVRMGAVTHNFDMEQRFLPLDVEPTTGGLTIDAPASANLAPPGWYMLFAVDGNGVPSVARIVRVGDPEPSLAAGSAAADGAATESEPEPSAPSGGAGTESEPEPAAPSAPSVEGSDAPSPPSGDASDPSSAPSGEGSDPAPEAPSGDAPAAGDGPATVDTAPPRATLTDPLAGEVLSGEAAIAVRAADEVGMASVQLHVDGTAAAPPDTTSPFSFDWNTRTAADGLHTLTAIARDAAGNEGASAGVQVAVDNGSGAAEGAPNPGGKAPPPASGAPDALQMPEALAARDDRPRAQRRAGRRQTGRRCARSVRRRGVAAGRPVGRRGRRRLGRCARRRGSAAHGRSRRPSSSVLDHVRIDGRPLSAAELLGAP